MQFNIEQLNIGKADNSTFNIQNSTLNIAVGFPLEFRRISVLPTYCLRCTSDTSSIHLRLFFDSRTKLERRMNEG